MSLRKKSLFVALESTEEKSTVSLEAIALEAEEEMVEMREEAEDIVSDTDTVEEAAEDVDTLEKIKDTMEESVEEGEGVSEDAAEIAEVAIESIYDRLGLDTSKVMPAMESFGSSFSRVTATKIAIEGIKETLTKVWEGIKAFFTKLWEKIKEFYNSLTSRVAKIEQYIKTVKEVANKKDFSFGMKEKELSDKRLSKFFSINKNANFDTAKKIAQETVSLVSVLPDVIKVINDGIEKYTSLVTEYFNEYTKTGKFPTDDLNEKLDVKTNVIEELVKLFEKVDNSSTVVSNDETIITIENLPNTGKLILSLRYKDNKINLSSTVDFDENQLSDNITALEESKIKEILDLAEKNISEADKYKKVQKEIQKGHFDYIKLSDNALNFISKVDKNSDAADFKIDKNGYASLGTFVNKVSTVSFNNYMNTVHSLVTYAKLSIDNYKTS